VRGGSGDRRRILASELASERASPGLLRRLALASTLLAIGSSAAVTAGAGAASSITLPGSPLIVAIGTQGQCQSSYANAGEDFFTESGTTGDCGFFLGFPSAGNPSALSGPSGRVFGFKGEQGPALSSTEYAEVSAGSPTGGGSEADPYKLVTRFKIRSGELDYALITETTTYVNGSAQFASTFDVKNITGEPESAGLKPATAATLRFHAIYAGDLFTDDTDFGTGLFLAGPPRFVGGQNDATGVLGGFIESGAPEWSNWQTGCWNVVPETRGRCPTTSPQDAGIWAAVRAANTDSPVFNDDIDPNLIDNAVGVSWDDHLETGLEHGRTASYSIINRAQIPAGLSLLQATQAQTVGQTGTVIVTARDTGGTPYAGRPIVYAIGGANPKTGSVTTDASGQAVISYVGTAAGLDTMQLFLDLGGSGTRESRDPAAAAQITWLSPPPGPSANSSYTVKSVHANSDGTITIVFVPVQDGTAVLEVTAPTATISRNASIAKRTRCKRSQARIKGRCRPRTTLSGRTSATGKAGVARKLTVRASRKVRIALAKGKKVQLTAKLSYRSKLGGAAKVRTLRLAVRGKRRSKRH
jgi:hypothetical protein